MPCLDAPNYQVLRNKIIKKLRAPIRDTELKGKKDEKKGFDYRYYWTGWSIPG